MVLFDIHTELSVCSQRSHEWPIGRCDMVAGNRGTVLYFFVFIGSDSEQKEIINCSNSTYYPCPDLTILRAELSGCVSASPASCRFAHAGGFARFDLAVGSRERFFVQAYQCISLVVCLLLSGGGLPDLSRDMDWRCIGPPGPCTFLLEFHNTGAAIR